MHEIFDQSQLINRSSIPTFVIDRNHRVTHWNRACEVLTGMAASEVIGTSNQWMAFYGHPRPVLADLIVDEADEEFLQSYYDGGAVRSLLIEDAYEVESFCMTFRAGGKWLFFTSALLRDPENRIIGAIETLQDVSDRRIALENEQALRLELAQTVSELQNSLELLQETQQQLIQSAKMAALGGLVAGVAHEINTPVGIGVTAASLLAQKTRECSELFATNAMKRSDLESYFEIARESSKMILSNLERASDLIQRFKQVAVDQTSENMQTIVLKECLDNILLSLHPALKMSSHTVQVQCGVDIVLESYAGALEQVVTILVMNSLVHGFEGVENGIMGVEVCKQQDHVVIQFSDNGNGIPEEYLEKIFDPFFTTKRGNGGTGLGLHILYNLVTQTLGGIVECESHCGQGTTFRMTIPQVSPPSRSTFFHSQAAQ